MYVKLERHVAGVLGLEMAPSSRERREAISGGQAYITAAAAER
jgi:hypothetical protein